MPSIAIVGASSDKTKFGNKAVRAYLKQGWTVFPIHPKEETIEGLKVYRSVKEIPEPLDRVTLYVAPKIGMGLLEEMKGKVKELFVNPGAESDELLQKAKQLGLNPVFGCVITDVGESPAAY